MNNYKCQDGCHNCKFVFRWQEHDEGTDWFCTFGAPPRPLSGSICLNECGEPLDDYKADEERRNRIYEAWEKWSECRSVSSYGKCDNWEIKE